jgi:hypothetical protein
MSYTLQFSLHCWVIHKSTSCEDNILFGIVWCLFIGAGLANLRQDPPAKLEDLFHHSEAVVTV